MTETSRSNQSSPVVFDKLHKLLAAIASISGTIKTIVDNLADIGEKGPTAIAVLEPLTYYTGLATVTTALWTYILINPIFSALQRFMEPENRDRYRGRTVVVFGVLQLFFAFREGSYQAGTFSFLQLIGGAVLAYAAYILYPLVRRSERGAANA